MKPKPGPVVAYRECTDGTMRPIYADEDRQYVVDDNGLREYGVFYIPPEECPGGITVQKHSPPA